MSEVQEGVQIEQPQITEQVAAVEQPKIDIVGTRSYSDMQQGTGNAAQEAIFTPPAADTPVVTEPAPVIPEPLKPTSDPVVPVAVDKPAEVPVFDKYKELGIDESQKEDFENILQAWKTGKIDEFIKVKNTDYDAMANEELVRMALKSDNPLATPKQLDVLHKQYLKSLGATEDSEDPDTLEAYEIYNLKAETMRDALKAKKAEYKLPEYKVPDQPAPVDPQVMRQEVEQSIKSDPAYNAFATNRIVTMGSGEETYKYEVPSTVDVMEMTANPAAFNALFADNQGKFDMNKWIKAVNYVSNMDKIEASLIDFGKTQSAKKQFDALNNPKPDVMTAPVQSGDQFQLVGQRSYRELNGR